MNDMTISGDEIKAMGRIVSGHMPEYAALKNRLRAESPNVRRAVANALVGWAYDPIADMSPEELEEELARVEAELARRGEAAAVR
jgi:hypothetical protein